jgi:lipoate-protein ligase B
VNVVRETKHSLLRASYKTHKYTLQAKFKVCVCKRSGKYSYHWPLKGVVYVVMTRGRKTAKIFIALYFLCLKYGRFITIH